MKQAEPTPEELEELRKKNERRERAHRANLQRKASGAQKRYEDKIKAAIMSQLSEMSLSDQLTLLREKAAQNSVNLAVGAV